MRTTMTIDDATMRNPRRLAAMAGLSMKETVHRVLRAGLAALAKPPRRRSPRVHVFAMGTPSVDMDKALQLAGEMEDEEAVRTFSLRK